MNFCDVWKIKHSRNHKFINKLCTFLREISTGVFFFLPQLIAIQNEGWNEMNFSCKNGNFHGVMDQVRKGVFPKHYTAMQLSSVMQKQHENSITKEIWGSFVSVQKRHFIAFHEKESNCYICGDFLSTLVIPSNLHNFMITLFIRMRSILTIIVWLLFYESNFSFSHVPCECAWDNFAVKHGDEMRKIVELRRNKCKFSEYLIARKRKICEK